jgi:parallel beta-helix repeat protein
MQRDGPAITNMILGSGTESELDQGGYYLSNVSVANCLIRSFEGIYLMGVEDVEVRNSEFYGFPIRESPVDGVPDGDLLARCGIHADMCGTVSISSNCLMGFYGSGIRTESCSAVRVVNNIVLGCDMYGISADGTSVMVTNNTLVSNESAIGVKSVTAAVANNLAYLKPLFTPEQDGAFAQDVFVQATEGLTFVNNDLYREIFYINTPLVGISEWGFPPGYFIYLHSDADFETVLGNIFEDPLLVGWSVAASGATVPGLDGGMIVHGPGVINIFKIRQLSPCVNAGFNASTDMYGNVYDDFFGTARPQGGSTTSAPMNLSFHNSLGHHPAACTHAACLCPLPVGGSSGTASDEPTDEMAALIAQIQGHVANAAQLTNPSTLRDSFRKPWLPCSSLRRSSRSRAQAALRGCTSYIRILACTPPFSENRVTGASCFSGDTYLYHGTDCMVGRTAMNVRCACNLLR